MEKIKSNSNNFKGTAENHNRTQQQKSLRQKEVLVEETKKNLIAGQYVCNYSNYATSVDITDIGKNGKCFVAMDLATRAVIGHIYKDAALEVQDITDCLEATLKARKFLPNMSIIHSDRESYFKNQQYYELLQKHNITPSRGSAEGRSNMVSERAFRTLKNILRRKINPLWKENSKADPLNQKIATKVMAQLIKTTIEDYNNKPHSKLRMLSPNAMEEALYNYLMEKGNNKKLPAIEQTSDAVGNVTDRKFTIEGQSIPVLTANKLSTNLIQAEDFKNQVVQHYAGDWVQFFKDFRTDTTKSFKLLEQKSDTLYQQNKKLSEQNEQLQETLNFVQEELQVQKDKRIKLEIRRERLSKAKREPTRESVSIEDLNAILAHKSLNTSTYAARRRKTGIIMLYATGLRITNLLNFSVKSIDQVIQSGTTKIDIIKKGATQQSISISQLSKELINKNSEDFFKLMEGKNSEDPFFTTSKELKRSIHSTAFDKEINDVLKQVSLQLNKHMRSHSFRVAYVTDLLKSQPIQRVARIMGHQNIGTTAIYDREELTQSDMVKVLHALDESRLQVTKLKADLQVAEKEERKLKRKTIKKLAKEALKAASTEDKT